MALIKGGMARATLCCFRFNTRHYKTLQVGNWRSAFNELGEREEKMYDISLLNSLSKTLHDLPPNLTVRPLQLSDYSKGEQ